MQEFIFQKYSDKFLREVADIERNKRNKKAAYGLKTGNITVSQ